MKKLLLGLSSLATVIAPVATAVSCAESDNQETQNNKSANLLDDANEEIKKIEKNPESVSSTKKVDPKNDKRTDEEKIMDIIKTQDFKEDGLYMTSIETEARFFNDRVQDDYITDSFVQLPKNDSPDWGKWDKNIIAVEPRLLKFYVVFDDDDSDGLSPDKFEEEFHILDPNYVKGSKVLDDANREYGNTITDDGNVYVNFKDGRSNKWTGSLFSDYVYSGGHDQGAESRAVFYNEDKPEVIQAMEDYIDGLHQEKNEGREPVYYLDENNDFVFDDQGHMLRNEHPIHYKLHDYYMPAAREEGTLIYKKISDRVFEITTEKFLDYNINEKFRYMNSLGFALTPTNGQAAEIYSPFIFDNLWTGAEKKFSNEDFKKMSFFVMDGIIQVDFEH